MTQARPDQPEHVGSFTSFASPMSSSEPSSKYRATMFLLACGILSPVLYTGTDILASMSYPGYSYRDQAVSELFAIGAPSSALVVPLFTLSSIALALFAAGAWWCSAARARAVRVRPLDASDMRLHQKP